MIQTQDPNIVSRLNQSFAQPGQSILQLRTELTQQWLGIMQLIADQLEIENQVDPVVNGSLTEAINALQKAESLLISATPSTAARFLNIADQKLAAATQALIAAPQRQFQSKTSSPLLMHASFVPLHWRMANALNNQRWQPNALAGGDFGLALGQPAHHHRLRPVGSQRLQNRRELQHTVPQATY